MNKVITINLNGVAYQLEEGGYEALRAYLDNAARRLEGNPDKDEIIADIEQAIADKFRAALGAYKTVVITREVEGVIAEMGPVQDASEDEPSAGATSTSAARPATDDGAKTAGAGNTTPLRARRLYKVREGAMIAGVCNGLAAYFNIDVTIVRLLFVLLVFTWGTGILVYIVMAIVVPSAWTPEEKAAASGMAATAEEFVRRAKAGYYEGFRTFGDKQAHREWKQKFKEEMRGWKYNLRRDMQENAFKWQQNWHQRWAQHPPYWAGAGPILRLTKLLFFGLLIYGIYSLFTHGSAFGVPLPGEIPVWIGIIFLLIAYHIVTWPIKAMRYACYHPGGPPWGGGLLWAGPLHGIIWLCFLGALIWLADHFSPEFHAWLQGVPPAIHHFKDSVREWWARR